MGTTTTSQGATADGLIVKEDLQPVVECVNGFDYAVHIKTITGIPPLSFHSMGQTLIWSLDGNTDSGNSVGDKTSNMFDIASWIIDKGGTYTKDGESYTFETKQNMHNIPYYFSESDIPVSISCILENVSSVNTRIDLLHADGTAAENSAITELKEKSENIYASGLRLDWSTGGNVVLSNLMLNTGSTAKPYEPYGYDIPIVVNNTDTYHCYITDVLRKSNGETPVYDTMSSDGTIIRRVDTDGTALEEPITETYTAPNVNVSWGNNTVDVDTTVSPTSMTITYKDN